MTVKLRFVLFAAVVLLAAAAKGVAASEKGGPAYRADAEALLAECAARDVGVQVIKAVAHRPWGDREKTAGPWYEPFTDPVDVARGVRFALSTPGVHAFCTPGDVDVLVTALDAAEAFTPMDDGERDATIHAMQDAPVIFPLLEHARR